MEPSKNFVTLRSVVAAYFFDKVKTAEELREVIAQLVDTGLFGNISFEEAERVARYNEATQGIRMF